MTVTSPPTPTRLPRRRTKGERPPPPARRFGYLVAASVDVAMLYAVNVWPGWDALPFLTEDTERVLPAMNLSIVAGLVVNLVYLGHDPRWLRGLGDMVTTAFSLVALVRVWAVFPFAFGSTEVAWDTVTRVLLGFGMAGTVIGFVAGLVALVRHLPDRSA